MRSGTHGWAPAVSSQNVAQRAGGLEQWQEERSPMMRHGIVVRPTMFLASLDIKTAFDEARPRHVAKMIESHDQHRWLIAAILREMSGLEGKAIGLLLDNKGEKAHQVCGFTWADGEVGLGTQACESLVDEHVTRLKKDLRYELPPTG